jgi:hypothetical protein
MALMKAEWNVHCSTILMALILTHPDGLARRRLRRAREAGKLTGTGRKEPSR